MISLSVWESVVMRSYILENKINFEAGMIRAFLSKVRTSTIIQHVQVLTRIRI